MGKEKILIVDDDRDIRKIIKMYIEKEGFQAFTASSGNEAIQYIQKENLDFIILDILMPGLDGYETCQEIRKMTDAPILFLSAKEDDIDKILGLRIGGDDYMTKPFSPGELVARIKAHLRRQRMVLEKSQPVQEEKNILQFPGLSINLESCVVKVKGKPISFPAKEFQLLSLLSKNPEKVFSVEQLFKLVWGEDGFGDYRTVMVHISNLRKKIEEDTSKPKYILTVRGIGYKFNGYLNEEAK